jgi:hypothetical protein
VSLSRAVVGWLQVDVEGYEGHVFAGAELLLKHNPPAYECKHSPITAR